MRHPGTHKPDPAGLQPFRDAGLLLLLALLLGSVRIGGEGIKIPALEKLAGAHAAPATMQLQPARAERVPAPDGCDGRVAPLILIETVDVDREGERVRVEAACTS